MANAVLESESELDVLSDALSRTRALRALVNTQTGRGGPTHGELGFHLGCAEVALLRLLLEEEHRINSFSLDDDARAYGDEDLRAIVQGEG